MHSPTATNVTALPVTAQIFGLWLVKLTGKPEDAVALRSKGESPSVLLFNPAKVIVWLFFCPTLKLCVTGVAGSYVLSPLCVAWIEHVPIATNVTMLPLSVQTLMGCAIKLTGNPDVDVALSVNGGSLNVLPGKAANVIVWSGLSDLTAKLWLTGVAAKKNALPTWVASIVQVPVVSKVTVLPLTVQTLGVIEEKLTVNPDGSALATSAKSRSVTIFSGGVAKVRVCAT